MFRKKNIRVTMDVLHELLEEVRLTFSISKAPECLKKQLEKIHPIFDIVNRPNWNWYGSAFAVGRCAKKCAVKRKHKLKAHTHPTTLIDYEHYFLVIQINKGLIRLVTRRGLRYLVAHELAHILLTAVNEEVDAQFSYCTSEDHGKRWIDVCKWMGGKGTEFIQFKELWC